MKLDIKSTNLELTPAIRDYVEQKMSMVEKYLGSQDVIQCDIELELTTNHHHKGNIFRAEVNLQLAQELLRVERTEDDLYRAIDKVKDHLADVINKYKEKRLARRRESQKGA